MVRVKYGDKVQVHYTGTLDDGSVFGSSEKSGEGNYRNFRGSGVTFGPMEFVIGQGHLFPKFEEAVIGLEPGQSIKVKIASEDAYGPRNEEMIAVVPRGEIAPKESIPEDWRVADGKKIPAYKPKKGDPMEVALKGGASMQAIVTDVTDTTVTIDANHPLAGKDLIFDIQLVDIL